MYYTSLPGTSGTLSPYSDMKSFYFDDSDEPDSHKYEFIKEMKDILEEEKVHTIDLKFNSKEDYYKVINNLQEFARNGMKVYGTSKNAYEVIVEDAEDLETDKTG